MRRDQGRVPPPGYVRAYDGFWAHNEVVGGHHHLDGSCDHYHLSDHDDQGGHHNLSDHDDQGGFEGFEHLCDLDDRRAYDDVFIVTFSDDFCGAGQPHDSCRPGTERRGEWPASWRLRACRLRPCLFHGDLAK